MYNQPVVRSIEAMNRVYAPSSVIGALVLVGAFSGLWEIAAIAKEKPGKAIWDLTVKKSDRCKVHHMKMIKAEAPIDYGLFQFDAEYNAVAAK